MAADFPDNPSVNDTFTVSDRTWIWNGTTWDALTEEVLSADAPITFDSSTRTVGIDETAISIDQDQVTGLADGTSGYSAVSDGTSLTYQPVSHNYIINGAFDIWQRGNSFLPAGQRDYTADRFAQLGVGGTVNITKKDFTAAELEALGFGDAKHYLELDATTGANFQGIYTRLEDVRTLAGQEVTFSFYAKGTNPGTGGFNVYIDQIFGDGGSANARNLSTTVQIDSSWTRYSFTGTLGSMSGKTIEDNSFLEVVIRQTGTSSDPYTLNIWGVQLEAGSIATPFKRNANSIAGELAACQRYYQRVSENSTFIYTGFYNTTTTMIGDYQYPVTMRRIPDFNYLANGAVYTGSSVIGTSDFDAGFIRTTSARFEVTTSAQTLGAAATFRINSSGDTFFELDAEL